MRRPSVVIALVALLTACSADPLEGYLGEAGEILANMRRDSVTALPDPAVPTWEGVTAVTATRQGALDHLEVLVPPPEVQPEHTALLLALRDLVTASDRFLSDSVGLNDAAFGDAIRSATALDEPASRVAAACDALERRAAQLGHEATVRC